LTTGVKSGFKLFLTIAHCEKALTALQQ